MTNGGYSLVLNPPPMRQPHSGLRPASYLATYVFRVHYNGEPLKPNGEFVEGLTLSSAWEMARRISAESGTYLGCFTISKELLQ